MIRFLLRTLGLMGFAAGFVLAVIDGTRSIAASGIDTLPLGAALETLAPRRMSMLETAVTRHVHPLLWDPVLVGLLTLPAFAALFIAAAVLYRLGRPAADDPAGTGPM